MTRLAPRSDKRRPSQDTYTATPHNKYTILGKQQKASISSGSAFAAPQPNRLLANAFPFLTIVLKTT